MTFRPCIRSLALQTCVAAVLTLGMSPSDAADYRLRAGDVVEISVAGLPQFGLRAPIQLDGTITIPTIGSQKVEGATLSEVRDRIQVAFTSRILTLYTSDGRELTRTVEREDVAAAIVQYAPKWVSGDVVRYGELTLQPRMTVRQAIATADCVR